VQGVRTTLLAESALFPAESALFVLECNFQCLSPCSFRAGPRGGGRYRHLTGPAGVGLPARRIHAGCARHVLRTCHARSAQKGMLLLEPSVLCTEKTCNIIHQLPCYIQSRPLMICHMPHVTMVFKQACI
jgi:hypothetical protein